MCVNYCTLYYPVHVRVHVVLVVRTSITVIISTCTTYIHVVPLNYSQEHSIKNELRAGTENVCTFPEVVFNAVSSQISTHSVFNAELLYWISLKSTENVRSNGS